MSARLIMNVFESRLFGSFGVLVLCTPGSLSRLDLLILVITLKLTFASDLCEDHSKSLCMCLCVCGFA